MRNKSFSYRINFIHIVYYVFLSVLVFICNYIIIKNLTIEDRIEHLTGASRNFNQIISDELRNIENNSISFSSIINSGSFNEVYLNKTTELISGSNELIGNIFLINSFPGNYKVYDLNPNKTGIKIENINFNDSCFGNNIKGSWGISNQFEDSHLFYTKKINNNFNLIVFIDSNYLKKILSGNNIFTDEFSTISDKNQRFIATSGTFIDVNPGILIPLTEALKNDFQNDVEELTLKYWDSKEKKYFSHTIFNKDFGIFISLNQPRSGVIKDLIPYYYISTIIFIITICLISALVYLSNHNLTKSFNELFRRVQRSAFLKLKPSSFESEVAMIHKSFDLLENQLRLYEKNIENISKNSSGIENDLKIAKKLQSNLLPTLTPNLKGRKEFELYAHSESLFEIGGDFYDYFLIDDENLLVAVADVSGKGIPASLFMIYTHTLLRSIPEPEMRPSEIISKLNNKLIEENISDMFVTVFLGILKINTGEFLYCNAAHNYPLIIHNEGKINELTETHGIPIGIYTNRKYTDSSINLNAGDQVFIYTDGLIDTIDENGLKFTVDVLKYNLMGTWFFNTKEVVDKINRSVINFRGIIKPGDDLTILNLKFKPGSVK